MSDLINKGRNVVWELFTNIGKKETKKVDIQAQKQQAIDKRVTHKVKFDKASYGNKRIIDKTKYAIKKTGQKVADAASKDYFGLNNTKKKKKENSYRVSNKRRSSSTVNY